MTIIYLFIYCFKEINENSALLLYISADGTKPSNNNEQNSIGLYECKNIFKFSKNKFIKMFLI